MYNTGTLSAGRYSLSELNLLKPLMKSQSLLTEQGFERAFRNLIDFQSNKTEMESLIWSNVCRPMRQEFLNDLPTRLLAIHRAGSNANIVFWQDTVDDFLTTMSEREPVNQTLPDATYYNSFGVVVEINQGELRVAVGNRYGAFPTSERSLTDIHRLVKYIDKLVATIIRFNLIAVINSPVTLDCTPFMALEKDSKTYCVRITGSNVAEYSQAHFKALQLDADALESNAAHKFANYMLGRLKALSKTPYFIKSRLNELVGWEPLRKPTSNTVAGHIKVNKVTIPVTDSLLDALQSDREVQSITLSPSS